MNFDFDNSTQTNTALTTTGTSYTYVNSNDLSTKQNLLDASTNLLGIGTSISALNYNNITLNKPTNFQSDWNSTIINKLTYFQSDWSTTITNKPDLNFYPLKTYVDGSLNTSRARRRVRRARLTQRLSYNLRANLARKSDPRTTSSDGSHQPRPPPGQASGILGPDCDVDAVPPSSLFS